MTSIATAARPEPEPFSTTGYTTNLVQNPYYVPPPGPTNPPLLPSEFAPLPSGHTKFHISAQGGPGVTDDCQPLLDLYGMPSGSTCEDLCLGVTGQACGATGMFDGGSFTFEEWGIADQTNAGVNYGDMTIITEIGNADMRFSGQASSAGVVQGSFRTHRGKVGGTYIGNAGYVFTVDYTPCGGKYGPECPAGRCAVFGDDLKLNKKKAGWKIENDGENDLTISSITINWLGSDIPLKKVKLGGKTIYDQEKPAPWTTINADWQGELGDRQIKSGKQAKLTFEFEDKEISQNAWDYTILVEFAEGCAVTFVDFAPPTP